MIPQFNFIRLKAILQAVNQLGPTTVFPIVVGESRGRLGNLYVLGKAPVEQKPTPVKLVPPKSVHWEDISTPGVETQTTIPPYKQEKSTREGVWLLVIAAALVGLTVFRR